MGEGEKRTKSAAVGEASDSTGLQVDAGLQDADCDDSTGDGDGDACTCDGDASSEGDEQSISGSGES
jgi:hypothetical protein